MIKGYKAVYKDGTDKTGRKFEVGGKYCCDDKIAFTGDGDGIHFCARMEDSLRFVDGLSKDVKILEVVGSGTVIKDADNVYDYHDMYLVSDLEVKRELSREEIINHFLNSNELTTFRFLRSFKLGELEKEMFKLKFADNDVVQDAIAYYHEGDQGVYYRRFKAAKVKKVGEVSAQ